MLAEVWHDLLRWFSIPLVVVGAFVELGKQPINSLFTKFYQILVKFCIKFSINEVIFFKNKN